MSSNPAPTPGDVFDVRKVRQFIELMNEHELSEIDLRQGDQRIRVRRGPETVTMAAMPGMSQAAVGGGAASRGAAGDKGGAEPAADESKALVIRSPMVGTFYAT